MKRIIAILLTCAMVLGLCACGPKGPTWQEQYDLGVKYLSEGNYEEAILAFTAAIEIDPKRAEAYVGRGDACIASGESEENLSAAQADYEQALALDESLVDAWLGLSDVYIRLGEYDKALEILQQGLLKTQGDEAISGRIVSLNSGDTSSDTAANTGYNAYGGTEFTHRGRYRDVASLTDQEAAWLEMAWSATVNKDVGMLCQLNRQLPEDFRLVDFLTVWNEYKVKFRCFRSESVKEEALIQVEFRPENGTGYYFWANGLADNAWCTWASCPCVDWQWNGEVTENGMHYEAETGKQVTLDEETGPMENGLRNGVFVNKQHSKVAHTSLYQKGLRIEYDGRAEEDDNFFRGIAYGFDGPLESQAVLDEFYW